MTRAVSLRSGLVPRAESLAEAEIAAIFLSRMLGPPIAAPGNLVQV